MREYKQMNLENRIDLYAMKKSGESVKEVAQKVGKHRSALYRELNRNTTDVKIGYLPDSAHSQAKTRKAKLKPKLDRNPELKKEVIAKLKDGWAPAVIAGRLMQQQATTQICHESIYQYVYSSEGKERKLFQYLLRGQPKRQSMKGRKPRKSIIPHRVSIHDRPEKINSREEFGHLEGDLTFNHGNQSVNLMTVVERQSRITILAKNSSKKADGVMQNMFNKIAVLPPAAGKSMTMDNGSEFVGHMLLKEVLKTDTYFCDPHSPWQKGQVEKTNSMIHRYIPKNRPLSSVSDDELAIVEWKLNNTPRKILGFRTPAEVFTELVFRSNDSQGSGDWIEKNVSIEKYLSRPSFSGRKRSWPTGDIYDPRPEPTPYC